MPRLAIKRVRDPSRSEHQNISTRHNPRIGIISEMPRAAFVALLSSGAPGCSRSGGLSQGYSAAKSSRTGCLLDSLLLRQL